MKSYPKEYFPKLIMTLFLASMLLIGLRTFAQSDAVYITNGVILYGEIKSFDRNVMVFDTDYADSDFKIEWDEVEGLAT